MFHHKNVRNMEKQLFRVAPVDWTMCAGRARRDLVTGGHSTRRPVLLSAAILGLTGRTAPARETSDTNAPDTTSNAPAMDGMPMTPHAPMRQ